MTIYEANTTVVAVAGAAVTSTLYIPGGVATQLLIRANTATTLFRADLKDEGGIIRRHYDFHTGELNDMALNFAVVGSYAVEITNASLNDTFRVILAVREQ